MIIYHQHALTLVLVVSGLREETFSYTRHAAGDVTRYIGYVSRCLVRRIRGTRGSTCAGGNNQMTK